MIYQDISHLGGLFSIGFQSETLKAPASFKGEHLVAPNFSNENGCCYDKKLMPFEGKDPEFLQAPMQEQLQAPGHHSSHLFKIKTSFRPADIESSNSLKPNMANNFEMQPANSLLQHNLPFIEGNLGNFSEIFTASLDQNHHNLTNKLSENAIPNTIKEFEIREIKFPELIDKNELHQQTKGKKEGSDMKISLAPNFLTRHVLGQAYTNYLPNNLDKSVEPNKASSTHQLQAQPLVCEEMIDYANPQEFVLQCSLKMLEKPKESNQSSSNNSLLNFENDMLEDGVSESVAPPITDNTEYFPTQVFKDEAEIQAPTRKKFFVQNYGKSRLRSGVNASNSLLQILAIENEKVEPGTIGDLEVGRARQQQRGNSSFTYIPKDFSKKRGTINRQDGENGDKQNRRKAGENEFESQLAVIISELFQDRPQMSEIHNYERYNMKVNPEGNKVGENPKKRKNLAIKLIFKVCVYLIVFTIENKTAILTIMGLTYRLLGKNRASFKKNIKPIRSEEEKNHLPLSEETKYEYIVTFYKNKIKETVNYKLTLEWISYCFTSFSKLRVLAKEWEPIGNTQFDVNKLGDIASDITQDDRKWYHETLLLFAEVINHTKGMAAYLLKHEDELEKDSKGLPRFDEVKDIRTKPEGKKKHPAYCMLVKFFSKRCPDFFKLVKKAVFLASIAKCLAYLYCPSQ